jgi:hypothetical protein
MEVETLADKIFMCNTLYLQGVLVQEIKLFLLETFGPLEASTILQGWKKLRYS